MTETTLSRETVERVVTIALEHCYGRADVSEDMIQQTTTAVEEALALKPLPKAPCAVEYRVGEAVTRYEAPTVEELNALVQAAKVPQRLTVVLDTKIVGPTVEEMARKYFSQRPGNPDGIPGA